MIKLIKSNRGNATLYTMLILPFAVGLSTVALNISSWNGARSSLQLDADRLALLAANMLPVQEGVLDYLEANLQMSVGGNRARVSVEWPDSDLSSVTVTLSATLNDPLSALFLSSGNHSLSRSATAAIVPIDYAVIVADGHTLRPGVAFSGAATEIAPPWGQDLDWPRSGYFGCVTAPSPSVGDYDWRWWENWSNDSFQRWLTQACFNPVWSKVKLSTIDLIDGLASDSRSRISLYFTPGDNSFERYQRVRSIHGEQDDPTLYHGQRGGFLVDSTASAQATFSDYVELSQLSSDELCLLMSDEVSALNGRYQIPINNLPNPSNQSCGAAIEFPFCGTRHIPYGRISNCYSSQNWLLREAIYYRQARLETPDFDAEPDIRAAVSSAFGELIDNRSALAISNSANRRQNLAPKARRRILVITDRLPAIGTGSGSFGEELIQMAQLGTEVAFIAVAHSQLSPPDHNQLVTRASEISGLHERSIISAVVEDLNELDSQVIPSILLNNRQIALLK